MNALTRADGGSQGMGSGMPTPSIRDHLRFLFEGLEVRAVDREARPWFVGKDVCAALGHKNAKDALSRLPDTDRATIKILDRLGREQATTIISLGGVFKLVMTSRVEGAARFQSWLTDEVLPSWYMRGQEPAPSTLATPTADLSALTEQLAQQTQAISSILPAMTAIATAVTALAARVDALERPALPAPASPIRLRDGIFEFGPIHLYVDSRGGEHPAQPRVHIKGGRPVAVYAGKLFKTEWLSEWAETFRRLYPGFHLLLHAGWRDAEGHGFTDAPRDAGMTARAWEGAPLTEAEWRSRLARVLDDEDGNPVAIEWTGPFAKKLTAPGLREMRLEARRLGYKAGPWRRIKDGWRAPVLN